MATLGRAQLCAVVFVSFTIQAVTIGTFFSYGQLFAALKEETGERGSILALIGSIRDGLFSAGGAIAGFALKRMGHVHMLILGFLMLISGQLLDSIVPNSYWLFFSFSFLNGMSLSILFTPGAMILYDVGMNPRSRAVAVGIASAGGGVGAMAANAVLGVLLRHFGWRDAQRFCALLCASAVVPCILVMRTITKQMQDDAGLQAKKASSSLKLLKELFQPLSEKAFLLLCTALILYMMGFTVPNTHLVFYARKVRGYEAAPMLMSTMGIASTVGRLSGGLLSALGPPSWVFCGMVMIQGGSLIWLAFCQEAVEFVMFAILFGVSSGARTGLLSLVIAEIFDVERLAHLYGLTGLPMSLGVLFGPVIVGALYDESGSYTPGFVGMGSLVLLAIVVFLPFPLGRCRPHSVGRHADSHAHVNDMREDGKDTASDEVSSTAPSSPLSDDSP